MSPNLFVPSVVVLECNKRALGRRELVGLHSLFVPVLSCLASVLYGYINPRGSVVVARCHHPHGKQYTLTQTQCSDNQPNMQKMATALTCITRPSLADVPQPLHRHTN